MHALQELHLAIADGVEDGAGACWRALFGLAVAIAYLVGVVLSPIRGTTAAD